MTPETILKQIILDLIGKVEARDAEAARLRASFPGDAYHRPGEPGIVDVPANAAGITSEDAEYERAMRAEKLRADKALLDSYRKIASAPTPASADPLQYPFKLKHPVLDGGEVKLAVDTLAGDNPPCDEGLFFAFAAYVACVVGVPVEEVNLYDLDVYEWSGEEWERIT